MHGCYLATHAPDAETGRRFTPDVLMANPPSFAHIHLAEALGRASCLAGLALLASAEQPALTLLRLLRSAPPHDLLHAMVADGRVLAPAGQHQVVKRQSRCVGRLLPCVWSFR